MFYSIKSPALCFSPAKEYANRKAKENQEVLELNGTHHLMVYSDDINILGENV
jgi:hypothetical protein